MAGDLNAKHVDWNSRRTTTRGKLLRDYASGNSCLFYGPDSPTTVPYNSWGTPDVLGMVITKDLTFPVYLTASSARSSDHLPVLIDTTCRSSFHNLPARPDYRRTDWVKFQASLEEMLPSTPLLPNEGEIDTAWRKCPVQFWRCWRRRLPRVALAMTHGPQYRHVFRMKYA
jgi:hypothetical protein